MTQLASRAVLGDVADELDALFRANPYRSTLGAELDDWGPGWARTSLVVTPAHANLVGTAHGGVVAALADLSFEVGCNGYGRVSVASSLSLHFTAPAPVGAHLTSLCVEQARSRRTASYRIDVTTGTGTLVAWFMALAYRTNRWHLGEDRYPPAWRDAH